MIIDDMTMSEISAFAETRSISCLVSSADMKLYVFHAVFCGVIIYCGKVGFIIGIDK